MNKVNDHSYHVHVRRCGSCSGPYGHCAEGLRLLSASVSPQAAGEGVPERIWLQPTRTSNGYFVTGASDDLGAVEYVRARAYSPTVDEAAIRQAVEKIVFYKFSNDPAQDVLPIVEIITTEMKGSK